MITLKRLFRLIWPVWPHMLMAIMLSTLTILSSIGLMAVSAWLISTAALQPSIAALGVAPVGVRFFGISRAVFRYLERLVSHSTTFRILAELRVWFFTSLESLMPVDLFDHHSGDLLQRIVTDVDELENVFSRVFSPPLVALIIALSMTGLLWGFYPPVALVLLATFTFTATGVSWWTLWAGRNHGRAVIAIRATMNEALVDGIQGVMDSLAYGYSDVQLENLERHNAYLSQQERQMAWIDSVQVTFVVLMTNLAALLVLIVAIPHVDGLFLAMITLTTTAAFEAIVPLGEAMQHLGANISAAGRLFLIIDRKPTINEPSTPSPQPQHYGITINRLSFRYADNESLIFDNFNLDIAAGSRVAIVGPSGQGKSTLINILLRFWEYEEGEIMLGNYNLRDYQSHDLYDFITIMSQRTHLFTTTIWENIRIARPDASHDEIMVAAKRAQIHDFIMSLPDGYNTYVGEYGVKLSGGEHQRIALARTLLRDAKILILDEPTAHLDAVTERDFLQSVLEVTQDRTLIMITHRMILTESFDQVMVIRKSI